MVESSGGGAIHKVQQGDGLGKSTLVSSVKVSIPMPRASSPSGPSSGSSPTSQGTSTPSHSGAKSR